MARPALPTFDGPHPQYNSLLAKGGTVLGQIRSVSPSDSIETVQAGRVGSNTKKTLRKSKNVTVSWSVWVDEDLSELAAVLGAASTPTTGQTLKLDPDNAEVTFQIENYDGVGSSSTLLSIIYMENYVATELSLSYDEDGEQVAEVTGTLEDLYWIVA